MSKRMLMVGKKFNRLLVLEEVRHPTRRGRFFRCHCDCGSVVTVYGAHLRNGSTKGCGCAKSGVNKTHGMSGTSEYRAWENARSRCQNPNNKKYPAYGGRGIKFCSRWQNSFQNFIDDMGTKPSQSHTLERVDSDGDYDPSNCVWATYTQQNNNRSLNRWLTVEGNRMTVAEAARAFGVPHGTILSRLDRGHSDEEAIRNG